MILNIVAVIFARKITEALILFNYFGLILAHFKRPQII